MRKHFGLVSIILGLLLIAGAIALVLYNQQEAAAAGDAAATAVAALSRVVAENEATQTESAEESLMDSASWWEQLPQNQLPEMPTVEIDGYAYIGVLEIPALQLSLPVIASYSHPWLRIAPNRYAGSVYSDDLVICAHNFSSHFGRIKNLPIGATVRFTDVTGRVWEYEVFEQSVLKSTDVEGMLQEGEWALTLYTCTKTGNQRETVRCIRV